MRRVIVCRGGSWGGDLKRVKRADWVTTPFGGRGIVRRVAKDGTWADVRWRDGHLEWSKRMRIAALIVQTSLPLGGGLTVTDMTRERELAEETP